MQRLPDRQVGDTRPFRFPLWDLEERADFAVPADTTFWIDMLPILAGGSAGDAKIDRKEMTADEGSTSASYSPTADEMDTAGRYTVQVYFALGTGEHVPLPPFEQHILANPRTLDFTP